MLFFTKKYNFFKTNALQQFFDSKIESSKGAVPSTGTAVLLENTVLTFAYSIACGVILGAESQPQQKFGKIVTSK